MQSENLLQSDLSQTLPDPGRSKKTNLLWLHIATFLLGVGLLTFVLYRIGFQSVIDSVSTVGWGFAVIIALNISRHLLRATTMYRAVHPDHRNFKYRSAVAARFGGEAVTAFTFAGPFIGDATKAVLLRKNVSLTQSASAVLIDNFLYYITVIIVILGGVATLLFTYGSSGSTMSKILLAIVIGALLAFALLILAMMNRVAPFTKLIGFLERRGWAPNFILKKKSNIGDVERNVFHFYHERRRDFFILLGISLSVHVISVTEVFMALKFLGHDPFVTQAFIIESLTKVINATFSFIPGTIGAYEGGNELILKTLGYTTGIGVALALVRRGAMLFSTFIGLSILIWRTAERGAKSISKSDPV